MLTTSPSRRRRASRSGGSSPQLVRSARSPGASPSSPGRRASIAVSPVDTECMQRNNLAPEINHTPRHSIIPDIMETRSNVMSPNPRHSITLDLSPQASQVPDSSRRARHSLVPGDNLRNPRNSLVLDSAPSPRNSLTPDAFSRSPRDSVTSEIFNSSRICLVPDSSRSPRRSLVLNGTNGSGLNLDPSRIPRNSLVPHESRSPRKSMPDVFSCEPRQDEVFNRSPRHSIVPDSNRSPRASIIADHKSPRVSNVNVCVELSPRGSIGSESNCNRSPHESLTTNNLQFSETLDGSPRENLSLMLQNPPLQQPRKYSTDYGQSNRSISPYRSSRGNISSRYNQSTCTEGGSRRASSSVSQVSGDEQKRLFSTKNITEGEENIGMGLTLATYGSVAYQLKDANLEANDACDFIFRALQIFNKTVMANVVLVCLSTLPLLMLIMGAHFVRDCPREHHIPIYMIVGGAVGSLKMTLVLWDQLYTQRLATLGTTSSASITSRMLSFALTIFLIAWFALGNYWILNIKWPDYAPTLFEPNRWCDRTLYAFSIVHLFIIYSLIGIVFFIVMVLGACQVFGCPWLSPTSTHK